MFDLLIKRKKFFNKVIIKFDSKFKYEKIQIMCCEISHTIILFY